MSHDQFDFLVLGWGAVMYWFARLTSNLNADGSRPSLRLPRCCFLRQETTLNIVASRYQTRGRVFHSAISKHREVDCKRTAKTKFRRVFFNQLRGVWKSDEILFRVFTIASQTNYKCNNSWRDSKQNVIKFCDN